MDIWTDRQMQSDAYEPTMQIAQVGSVGKFSFWPTIVWFSWERASGKLFIVPEMSFEKSSYFDLDLWPWKSASVHDDPLCDSSRREHQLTHFQCQECVFRKFLFLTLTFDLELRKISKFTWWSTIVPKSSISAPIVWAENIIFVTLTFDLWPWTIKNHQVFIVISMVPKIKVIGPTVWTGETVTDEHTNTLTD